MKREWSEGIGDAVIHQIFAIENTRIRATIPGQGDLQSNRGSEQNLTIYDGFQRRDLTIEDDGRGGLRDCFVLLTDHVLPSLAHLILDFVGYSPQAIVYDKNLLKVRTHGVAELEVILRGYCGYSNYIYHSSLKKIK